jgi:hypothetical protein
MVKKCLKTFVMIVLIEVLNNALPKSNIQCSTYTKHQTLLQSKNHIKKNKLWHFCSILFGVVMVQNVHINGRKLSYVG